VGEEEVTIKKTGDKLAAVMNAREIAQLDGKVVMLTDDGWVFAITWEALSADQVQAMGRDPGLRDT
jgi:hypothetical protein